MDPGWSRVSSAAVAAGSVVRLEFTSRIGAPTLAAAAAPARASGKFVPVVMKTEPTPGLKLAALIAAAVA